MSKKIECAKIVIDETLFPRGSIDSQRIGYIAEAMSIGREMPPIVVGSNMKLCDGMHRIKAALKVNGPNAKISADVRKFESDSELFIESARLNCIHGSNLTTYDRVRCIQIAMELGIADETLADAMNISVGKISELREVRMGHSNGDVSVGLKRTYEHWAGKKLSKKQQDVNKRSGGMKLEYYMNQIIDCFEAEMMDWEKKNFVDTARRLRDILNACKKL